jgi:hypothetical protein
MKFCNTQNSLGAVKATLLHMLQTNGRAKVLDLEMQMGRGGLRASVSSLVAQGYVARVKDVAFEGVAITNAGRMSIGVEVPNDSPQRPARVCNASQTQPLDLLQDTHMGRVGLARFGVAMRVGVVA